MAKPTESDREKAREIACGYLCCEAMRKEYNLNPDQLRLNLDTDQLHRLQCDSLTEYLITALAAVRAETVEQCAKLAYNGVTTSAGHSHSSRAIAAAIRSLANPGDNNV